MAFKGWLLTDGLELLHHRKTLTPHLFFQRLVVKAEHLLERDVRDEFGQSISIAKWQLHHTRSITDGRLGGHGAVSDDLGHLIGAIFVDHVVDDLATTFVVKVDVDVRQAHAVGVQEPLKKKVVLDRVDIGDSDAIGHGRTRGRPTAWPNTHPHFSRGRGEILDNQKISRIASSLYRFELKVDALPNLVGNLFVALLSADVCQMSEIGILSPFAAVLGVIRMNEIRRNVKRWQQHITFQHIALTFLHQCTDVRDGLGHICKQGLHLFWRLQIEAVVGEPKPEFPAPFSDIPLGLADVSGVFDTQQNVVGVALVLAGVIRIVACHHFHAMGRGKTLQHLIDHGLFFQPVAIQLRIEVVAHELFPKHECLLCLGFSNVQNQRRNLAKKPPCQHHKILFVLLHKIPIDARNVVKTVGVCLGRELGQVVVSVLVFGQKHRGVTIVLHAFVVHVAAHVQLCSNDGFDAFFVARPNELKGRHHVAMVSHCQRGHVHFFGRRDQLPNRTHGLKHTELGVHMKMCEGNILQIIHRLILSFRGNGQITCRLL